MLAFVSGCKLLNTTISYSGLSPCWLMRCFYFVEVYAAREKNGVYIPKERYYQEESERKVFFSSLS